MEAIILVGVPGAGKSTFYRQRFFNTHVRINLDMLKTRHREKLLLGACIEARQRFVVDNTNVSIEDRARYIKRARPAGYRIIGYYFECPLEEALRRNRQRQGKERIPDGGVRHRFNLLEEPSVEEGFDEVYTVSTGPTNEFVVCERLQDI